MDVKTLMPSMDWDDEDRVRVLYGPFRTRSLNPEAWESKMQFWRRAILSWCEQSKKVVFNLKDVEEAFEVDEGKPHCLGDVVDSSPDDFTALESLNVKLTRGWGEWGLKWAKYAFASKEPSAVMRFVSLKALSNTGNDILKTEMGVKWRSFRLVSSDELKAQFKGLSGEDLSLTVQKLVCDKLILDFSLHGKVYYKIPTGQQSPLPVSEEDIAYLSLLKSIESMESVVRDLEEKLSNTKESVLVKLKAGNRVQAKVLLKKSKHLETMLSKRMEVQFNLETLLSQIEESRTNSEVMRCYDLGVKALRSSLGETKKEDVNELLDDLDDLVAAQEEVSDLIANNTVDNEDLEKELEELCKEDDLSAKLDGLTVVDDKVGEKLSTKKEKILA